ncbi:MAG: hypothetical protein JNN30_10935 [Rhodanobacteraceae bacterium]|nr:hypothetical protein [Rhodanobacteraceae bacterium]
MKASAVVIVLIASLTFVAGATLESASRETSVPAAASTPIAAPKVAPERVATLVTLPEVTVRPSAEDLALAFAEPVSSAAEGSNSVPDSPIPARSGATRSTFDMPYYSFGKVLPQVSQD